MLVCFKQSVFLLGSALKMLPFGFQDHWYLVSETGSEANKANRQFKIIKHILKAFMLRRTKALLIERGILALPALTELTVSGSLLQENIFPFCCALVLFIFLIYFESILQDGAIDTVTKKTLHVGVAERTANTSFNYWRIVSPPVFAKHCNCFCPMLRLLVNKHFISSALQ